MDDNLLKGIHLVNVYDVKDWNWELFVICGAFFVAGIVILLLYEKFDFIYLDGIGCVTTTLSLIAACVIFACTLFHNYFSPTREYQIICDDSISFIDLEKKYDVISYDGSIYTIREEADY